MNEVHAIFHNPKEQEISVQKKLNFAKFQEKKIKLSPLILYTLVPITNNTSYAIYDRT